MPKRIMIISLAQINIAPGDKEKNLKRGMDFIEEAVKRGSDLIVFPELWTTGYVRNIKELSESLDGETIDTLIKKAKEKNIKIFGTIAEKENRYYNTMHFISPEGLEAFYRKIYLFSVTDEDRFFTSGDKIGVKRNIGMLICYDLRFPELSRKLVMNGAEIFIVCAEWPYPRVEHWRTLLRARAIDNQCYVIGCNRVGKDREFEYFGHSSVIDPWGRTVIEGETDETLLTCEIDLSLVREVRKNFPILKDFQRVKI